MAARPSGAELERRLHATRPDGTPCFEPIPDRASLAEWWHRLRQDIRENGDRKLASLAKRAEVRDAKPSKYVAKSAPAYHGENLRTSVLRTDWSTKAAQVAIDWSQPQMRCDVVVGRERLIAGEVPPLVTCNGQTLLPTGAWEEVCWQSDADADYLELEIALGGGVRLQRQFLLARADGLLYLADAVFCSHRVDLEARIVLPLAEARAKAVEETREIKLLNGKSLRLALPTALPEWRTEPSQGELVIADGAVTLRQSSHGAVALYAPLCLVVDPRRACRPVTWRRLTIGENLQIQPADRAAGYRLQLGKEQWLFYRSLTARANRTVLGVNLQTDFLCARFSSDGSVERLVEIEE